MIEARGTTVETLRNYIGGEWTPATASERQAVRNPATEQVLAEVPLSGAAEVDAAIQAAASAFPSWRATPPQERAQPFFRLRVLLDAHREDLATLITTEMGKTLDEARGEVQRSIENIEAACAIPSLMMGHGLESGAACGIDEEVIYQPLGVFAAICPFNFPLMIPFWFWPYAVGCGNTFVVKPSEQVPLTQRRVFELIDEAGFPAGVVNLVNGGREAVDALLAHPRIQGISFVGSTTVAQYVYARASASGKRVQVQGGAKNALVVMPDADLEASLSNILWSCYGAAGQGCLAGSMVIPVGNAHQRVLQALARGASAIRVGDGLDPSVQMGPLVSAAARDRVTAAIQQGVREEAELVLDGRGVTVPDRPNGYFVGPTLFDSVRPEMSLAREEILGPVVGVMPVDHLDQAVDVINRGPYGNAASIYTRSGRVARDFRYSVQAGNIGVNVGVAAPVAAFSLGGMKRSFLGTLRSQGRDAVRFFTASKVVITRWL